MKLPSTIPFRALVFSVGMLFCAWLSTEGQAFADDYSQRRTVIQKRDSAARAIPVIPPKICPMEQSARWVNFNPLGRFVHEFRLENKYFQEPKKGFFDLGDIAALVEPSLATWEVVDCPEVNWDLAYQFKGTKGRILRCGAIDREKTFGLFEERLARP